jgi:hypothetical protein
MTIESTSHESLENGTAVARLPRSTTLRYSLRHLFWLVTAVSILFAAVACFPISLTSIAVLLAVTVVALHLLSTAVGSHLRAEADRESAANGQEFPEGAMVSQSIAAQLSESGSHSVFRQRHRPVRRLLLLVAIGAVVGGVIGGAVLEFAVGSHATPMGIAVGAVSTAVVGGWCAFLGGCFWAILREGWRDAVAE